MNIEKIPFGNIGNCDIYIYKLKNNNGLEVHVATYGATVTSILVPEKDGSKSNIVCGFNTLEGYFSDEYIANAPYFGSTIGRYCSMINSASFNLNGKMVQVTKNAGDDNLHGGTKGFDKRIWDSEIVTLENGDQAIRFSLTSEDGDQGFPGKVDAKVTMGLTEANEFVIDYKATTDAPTPLAMTNHSYFNLSGFKNNVENYRVKINATKVLPLNESGDLADKLRDVKGQCLDLTSEKVIGDVQTENGGSFEHYYVFDGLSDEPRLVAEITDTVSNRKLEVLTTEHGMLLYTSKYTSEKLCRESGEQYGKHRAFCCETHRYPNGPNLKGAEHIITTPDQPFKSKTIFKFNF